jgi:hypothetical protein
MKGTLAAVALLASAWLWTAASRGATTVGRNDTSTPAELVRAVIRAEIDGVPIDRRSLLDQALADDPDFAPARFQSGFVRWGGGWLHVDDAADYVRRDTRLREYRKKRDALIETADEHRALATWCRQRKLDAQEKVHWSKVLTLEPQDAQAKAALGLRSRDGRLLNRDEIARERKVAAQRSSALREWRPRLVQWRRAIDRGLPVDRGSALSRLRALNDAAVIPALESVFAVDSDDSQSVARNRLMMETVGHMEHPDATAALVRWAVHGNAQTMRRMAVDELKRRPRYAYVPQLIDTFPGTIQIEASSPPIGAVSVAIRRQGNVPNSLLPNLGPVVSQAEFAQLRAAVERFQQAARVVTQNVQVALRESGLKNVDDRQAARRDWNEQNGWYTEDEPEQYGYQTQSLQVMPPQARGYECFPAGTQVVTLAGPMAIEMIRYGDQVLSQDPVSGELAYKTVLETTIRPPSPMVQIGLGADVLRTTRGHPVWVVGDGWKVAKDLSLGDRLHGLEGGLTVDSRDEAPACEAYNLVVDGWHTYFVGRQRVLVHDNSPPAEVPAIGPRRLGKIQVGQWGLGRQSATGR